MNFSILRHTFPLACKKQAVSHSKLWILKTVRIQNQPDISIFRYTEHSTVGLAQQWDQLNQLGMRIKHNLEQQIQARNQSGVSEDALKEFSMMFRHFDKDKTGRLDHNEFKSCLRALGYDLPMLEDGQPEPEFEAILDSVDLNRDGVVSLQVIVVFELKHWESIYLNNYLNSHVSLSMRT